MNRIPLSIRLRRLDERKDDDNANNIAKVKQMADMPIGIYLGAFSEELDRLLKLLGLSPEKAKCLYYRDIAFLISQSRFDWDVKDEAIRILTLPFKRCLDERTTKNEERGRKRGKNTA